MNNISVDEDKPSNKGQDDKYKSLQKQINQLQAEKKKAENPSNQSKGPTDSSKSNKKERKKRIPAEEKAYFE